MSDRETNVIPAQAGIHGLLRGGKLDSRLRGNDARRARHDAGRARLRGKAAVFRPLLPAPAVLTVVASLLGPISSSYADPARREPDARERRRTPVVEVFEKCRGAVVNIAATRQTEIRRGFGGLFDEFFDLPTQAVPTQSIGSGFVVQEDGFLVTNAHVVARAVELKVLFVDKTVLPAKLVAWDSERDLAVLKVEPPRPLEHLRLGRSDDLMVGETVVAIGNPLGYHHTCTAGIVSAVDREMRFPSGVVYRGLIQTDTSINPGNSGGPLLNINGELVGINTAIRGDAQNIGFAIPVDHLRELLPVYLDVERVRRVRLGMHLANETEFTGSGAPQVGVVVGRVDDDSPAARAGIREGDVLLSIGPRRTDSFLEAFAVLKEARVGESLELTLGRRGRIVRAQVAPADVPRPDGGRLMAQLLGIEVREMTRRDLRALDIDQPIGLVVTSVRRGSDAREAGLEPGDIVTKIAGHSAESLDFVGHVLERLKYDRSRVRAIYLVVLRVDGDTVYRATIRLRLL